MIRRQVGNQFWLIAQHDHALLAGELARHVGNDAFRAPTPRAVTGIELHDCGWPVHDDRPTLNGGGLPLDVFESPRAVALEVWQASVDRAIERDAYAAMLVSLHVLSLSTFLMTPPPGSTVAAPVLNPKARFEINRFQHKQIETQETLRKQVGLPVDVPMRNGLVEDVHDPAELELQFHFRLLQAMDQLSLGLCCTKPPWEQVRPVLARPGAKPAALRIERIEATSLRVTPWPFRIDRVRAAVPFRRVKGVSFSSVEEFRDDYNVASVGTMEVDVRPR
jgi:hypothetical protein